MKNIGKIVFVLGLVLSVYLLAFELRQFILKNEILLYSFTGCFICLSAVIVTKLVEIEDNGISPVIGVTLLVSIVVVSSAVVGVLVLGLGESLDRSSTAAVSVSDNTVSLVRLGSSERVIVQYENGTEINLTRTGDKASISGNVTIIGVSNSDDKTVLRTIKSSGSGGSTGGA